MRAIAYDPRPVGWAMCRLAAPFWKRFRTSALSGLRLVQAPPPALPGDDWVRLRTLLGGICGTDIALLAQRPLPDSILQAYSSTPMLLGHENVAAVDCVGAGVDPSWKDRRVCVEPTLCCVPRGIEPRCPRCRDGQFGACENFGAAGAGKYRLPAGTSIGYNSATGGSLGEFFVAHASQLVALDDAISDERAVLTDALACSLHAVLRADTLRAARVLVYGAGMLGLGVIDCLRATGFAGAIDAVSRHDYLDALARSRGADTTLRLPHGPAERFEIVAARTGGRVHRVRLGNLALSGGYDIAFDCVGSRQSMQECLKWTASRGQVVMVATGHGGRIDLTPVWLGELTVIGAYGRQVERVDGRAAGTYQLVHELMRDGKCHTDGLLTHTFRVEEYRDALELAMDKSSARAIRVALDFRGG